MQVILLVTALLRWAEKTFLLKFKTQVLNSFKVTKRGFKTDFEWLLLVTAVKPFNNAHINVKFQHKLAQLVMYQGYKANFNFKMLKSTKKLIGVCYPGMVCCLCNFF